MAGAAVALAHNVVSRLESLSAVAQRQVVTMLPAWAAGKPRVGVWLSQPIMTDAPFAPVDVLVVLGMGLFCFVPFGLFVRSVLAASAVAAE